MTQNSLTTKKDGRKNLTKKMEKRLDFFSQSVIITMLRLTEKQRVMRIGVMAAQQTLTLLVEVRVLYP